MKQHVQRFRGGDEAHRLPFWFYIPAFLAGFFPWSLFALPAFTDKGPFGAEEHAERLRRFLVGWALTVFVLFSIAGSKLVSYILPMYAPAALMVGSWLDRASTDIARRRSMSISISVAAILTLIPLLVITLQQQVIRFVESVAHQPARIKSIPAEFVPLVLHLADAAAAGICIALVLVMIKRVRWAIVSLVGGMMLFAVIAISDTIPAIDRFFSAPLQQAAREAGRLAGRKGHIAILLGPPRRPSVLFYLPGDMIAAAGRVTETTSDGLKTYLVANSTAVILTEERRLPEIETAVRTSPAARFGRWVVLRSE